MKTKGGGKRKGSSFERWSAKTLSLWLTGQQDKTQLIRSVTSGGWASGRAGTEPWRHVGDLAPNGPIGDAFRQRFGVECKHHRAIDLWDIWTRADGLVLKWWRKLLKEVAPMQLEPFLMMRANRRPDVVGLRESFCRNQLWGFTGDQLVPVDALIVCQHDLVLVPLAWILKCPPQWFVPSLLEVADVHGAQAHRDRRRSSRSVSREQVP